MRWPGSTSGLKVSVKGKPLNEKGKKEKRTNFHNPYNAPTRAHAARVYFLFLFSFLYRGGRREKMKTKPHEPAWTPPCRAELEKLDPRYAVVLDARWTHFDEGNCTAGQLVAYLRRGGHTWVPTVSTMNRWLAVILPIEAKHKFNEKV